ncbi:MAG: hypothetical protein R3F59_17040 [Myxococcota bacterium]
MTWRTLLVLPLFAAAGCDLTVVFGDEEGCVPWLEDCNTTDVPDFDTACEDRDGDGRPDCEQCDPNTDRGCNNGTTLPTDPREDCSNPEGDADQDGIPNADDPDCRDQCACYDAAGNCVDCDTGRPNECQCYDDRGNCIPCETDTGTTLPTVPYEACYDPVTQEFCGCGAPDEDLDGDGEPALTDPDDDNDGVEDRGDADPCDPNVW